jgi:phage terminase large subunit-like protein
VPPAANCRVTDCDEPVLAQRYCDGHLRERMPTEWQKVHKIFGRTEPRVFTPPLRPLTRKTSRGYEVIDFANTFGFPLLPWQEWAVIHALEILPDGSYRFRNILILVARQNGKSQLARVLTIWRMYMDGASRILGTAQDVALARDQWNQVQQAIKEVPELARELGKVRNVNGDENFEAAGCRYLIKALNRGAGRGGSNDMLLIDELREQRSWEGWAAVSKTTMARPNAQSLLMSNAGDDESVVLNGLHDAAISGTDPSICLLEWSAPDDCDLDDETAWAQANPGLGYTVSHAAIRSAKATDPPGIFRTEVLCQRVSKLDTAVDMGAWRDCADPAGDMDALRSRVVACFDVSPDEKHCCLVVAGKADDGRVRIEAAGQWTTTEAARFALPDLLKRISPQATGWYPVGPGAALAPIMRAQKGSVELNGSKVTEACQGLADLVKGRRIIHPGDPLLDAHIGGAERLPSGDGWRFTRRGGMHSGHVDAAYATAGAVYLAESLPPPKRGSVRVLEW